MTLALTYRPRSFAEVSGQQHVVAVLRAMAATRDVPSALLFAGSRGTGKTTGVRILAAALNCEGEPAQRGDACGTCPPCEAVAAGRSPSLMEVDAASNGLVADIRAIRDAMGYAHTGSHRVVALDEAHSMSKEAFNALLKVLEEPPPGTTFVLLTTEPERILPTVRSRCMAFEFRRLTTEQIAARLEEIDTAEGGLDGQRPVLGPEVMAEIARRAEGGMRDAVMLLDQATRLGVTSVEGLRQAFGFTDSAARLYAAALEADVAGVYAAVEDAYTASGDATALVRDLVLYTRDLLVLRAGGQAVADPAERERMSAEAAKIPTPRLIAVMRVLWQASERLKGDRAEQRASMALVATMVVDALGTIAADSGESVAGPIATPRPANPATPASTRLSLSEMSALAQS